MSIKGWPTRRKAIVGCLFFVLAAGSCGGLFFGILSLLKSSDAYTQSLTQAQSSEEVKKLIGVPVKPGFWLMGSIHISGSSGTADIHYPVSGPNGSGIVYVRGTKSEGEWHYSAMSFVLNDSEERVNLKSNQKQQH